VAPGLDDWQRRLEVLTLGRFPCTACGARVEPSDRYAYSSAPGRAAALCPACREQRQRERSRATSQAHRDRTREAKQPCACAYCGAAFTPQRSTARYCSTRCRVGASRNGDGAGRPS
jgi:hypothetical protein